MLDEKDAYSSGNSPTTQGTSQSQHAADPAVHTKGREPQPPSATVQPFLSVHVAKGATKQAIVGAIADALLTNDVPFFKDRMKPLGREVKGNPTDPVPKELLPYMSPAEPGASDPSRDLTPLNPDDGLVIVVQQEGWP